MKKQLHTFINALNQHQINKALKFLANDFQLHFTDSDFKIDKTSYVDVLGWDKGVQGTVSYDELEIEGNTITGVFTEKNKFFELLGIEKLQATISYQFNENGKITEQIYTPLPGQPSFQKKMQPAVEWAKTARPEILDEIYPQHRLTFNEEMGKRWVKLLLEWKSETANRRK